MAHGTPTLATGKICYLEIPAVDIERSSRFYRDAFGWELRIRGDGAIAFDDADKEVSGSWVTGRPPSSEPGIMVHIMVADLGSALAARCSMMTQRPASAWATCATLAAT